MKMIVSIIIPCYNEERTITLLLDALREQSFLQKHPESAEIIIADGFSSDKTLDLIQQWADNHPKLSIKVVENKKRIIPAALNTAINIAQGEYIVRLDAHSVPENNYIERCIVALKENKGVNIGGRWDILPGKNTRIARGIASAAGSPIGAGDAKYRYSETAGFVDTVPFGAYRRKTLVSMGGYDETLPVNEDYDLNVRIRRAGGKIWFDPEIRCVYYARESLSRLAIQYWRYGFWKLQMLKKDPKSIRIRQILPPLFILSLIVNLIGAFFHPFFLSMISLEIIVYLLLLLFSAVRVAGQKDDLTLLAGLPLAIITMHFAWGSGFLWSLVRSLFNSRTLKANKETTRS